MKLDCVPTFLTRVKRVLTRMLKLLSSCVFDFDRNSLSVPPLALERQPGRCKVSQ